MVSSALALAVISEEAVANLWSFEHDPIIEAALAMLRAQSELVALRAE